MLARFIAVATSPTALIIILHLGVTLTLAYKLNIWLDEAYTLDTTSRGLAHAFDRALHFEWQPPLYFVLLAAWRRLGDSVFFARLPSVAFTALTVGVAAGLARRYTPRVKPVWVVACTALNPFTIWAATEMRVYALVLLLSALLLLFFHDGFLASRPSRRAKWCYVVVAVLSLYTQYFLGFLLVANACALLALRRWRALGSYLACMAAVALAFAPMFAVVLQQMSEHKRVYGGAPTLFDAAGTIYWSAQEYLLPVKWGRLYFWRRWLIRFGLAALTLRLAARYRRGDFGAERAAPWMIAGATAACFVFALMLTSETLVQERHTAALFLPVVLAGFSAVRVGAGRRVTGAWVLLSVIFYIAALGFTYAPVAKRGDWSRVASYVAAREGTGQAILVFHAQGVLPLSHYYRGPNEVVPLADESEFAAGDVRDVWRRREMQITEALRSATDEHAAVWLITDCADWPDGETGGCAALDDALARNYLLEDAENFYYSEVRRLRRKLP